MAVKIILIVVFLLEVFLSHQNGPESGKESRWLADRTGFHESFLRSAAHVLMFAVLAALAMVTFDNLWYYGLLAVAAWAVLDEVSKPLLRNERHCSGKDILLNLAGTAIGGILALLLI